MRRFDPDDMPEALVHAAALSILADKITGEYHESDSTLAATLATLATGKGVDYDADGAPQLDADHATAVLAAVNTWLAARYGAVSQEAAYAKALDAYEDSCNEAAIAAWEARQEAA